MRTHGTLTKWNPERGFGFLAPATGGEDLFVHATAFPRDGRAPQVGEMVSFEVEATAEGKKRAVRVLRPGQAAPRGRAGGRESTEGGNSRTGVAAAALFALLVGSLVYARFSGGLPAQAPEALMPHPTERIVAGNPQGYQCDGRTHCSQMTSCEEAEYFLAHCPGVEMDGNHDGEPCERQWCK